MKKSILVLSVVLLIGLFPMVSYGNAGPIAWKNYPSYEMAVIEENSPIEVVGESLTFDFLNIEERSYAIDGMVTAKYQMKNTTAQEQSIQMAFPFVSSIFPLQEERIRVLVDKEPVPYDIYFGPEVGQHGALSQQEEDSYPEFREILESVSREPYQPEYFSEDTQGKHYTFKFQPTREGMTHFTISFRLDPKETQVLSYGFTSFQRDGNQISIGSGMNDPGALDIYVMGKDLDFTIKAYTDGSLETETDEFQVEVMEEESVFRDYFTEFIERMQRIQEYRPSNEQQQEQLYRFYIEALDRSFAYTEGCSSENELWSEIHQPRILLLMYSVEFPSNGTKTIEVSYKAQGNMDSRKTGKPIYSFEYMLHPAKYWKAFKDLDIRVIAPEDALYLIESNIEFSRTQVGVYEAFLSSLPEEDLGFSLYEKEKITLIDQAYGLLYSQFRYLTPMVIVAVMVLILIGVFIGARKKRKSAHI